MAIVKSTDYVLRAASELFAQFRKPDITALLTSYTKQALDIECALVDTQTSRNLDDASDAQLDLIGALLNRNREGKNDADYRAVLKAQIAVNSSRGTINDLVDIVRLVIGPTPNFLIEEFPLARTRITITDPTPPEIDLFLLTEMGLAAKAAGVKLEIFQIIALPVFGFTPGVGNVGFGDGHFAKQIL